MPVAVKYRSRAEARQSGSTWRIGDAVEARVELTGEMRSMLDRCDAERRELTASERRDYSRLEGDLDRINADIREHEAGQRRGDGAPPDIAAEGAPIRSSASILGERGEILAPEQRVADWVRSRPQSFGERPGDDIDPEESRSFSLGRAVRGMVSGQWDGADAERRALSEGTDSAGGFLTPEILSGPIIDKVRNQARVLQAGARTVPLESDKQSIPRLKASTTGEWRKEGEEVGGTDPEFERVTFEPKTLAVMLKMNMELFEDMLPESAQAIEADITKALSLELDRVCMRGSGVAPEPKGVLNQTSVTTVKFNKTPEDYDVLSDAVGTLLEANFEPNAAIYAARTAKTFGKLTDTTGQPLRRPPLLDGVTDLVSNQVPIDLKVEAVENLSEIYVAEWPNLMIGVRPQIGVRVKTLDQTFADKMQIGLLAWLRADVQLAHPEAFHVSTEVKA